MNGNDRGAGALSRRERFAYDIEEQWPSFKYLGFGVYYAWILLCYNSPILHLWPQNQNSLNDAQFVMYFASTIALAATLVLAALAHKVFDRLVENRLFFLGLSAVASLATFGVAWSVQFGAFNLFYLSSSVVTGVGTAFVALRLGVVFSRVSLRKTFMFTAIALFFASLLYFVCIGVPYQIGLLLTCSFPCIAALITMPLGATGATVGASPRKAGEGKFPVSFYVRLFLGVSVFSAAMGFSIGCVNATVDSDMLGQVNSMSVFLIGFAALLLFGFGGFASLRFNLVKLYYPLIFLAGVSLAITFFSGAGSPLLGTFSNGIYHLFIVFVWVLLAHVSYKADTSAVFVFGWGRGASAIGATVGRTLAFFALSFSGEGSSAINVIILLLILALFLMALIVLKEGTIEEALERTPEEGGDESLGGIDPFSLEFRSETEAFPVARGAWQRSCDNVADEVGLSNREREVLTLLSKGRTIEFIASELGISFNTSKSHVRHVYEKMGVHTRQELIDKIEESHRLFRGAE